MPSPSAPTAIPVHDADRDGNLFAWVLRLAAERRASANTDASRRAAYEAELARKFHELSPEARCRALLELPITDRIGFASGATVE